MLVVFAMLAFCLSCGPLGGSVLGVVVVVGVIYGLGAILGARHGVFHEKGSPYECGFEPIGGARRPFSLRFFLLLILFLVFDAEVVLLFSVLSVLRTGLASRVVSALGQGVVFLVVLLCGLWYEWSEGALE